MGDRAEGPGDAAVGVFDSGYGGLTVVRAILDRLPAEPIHYLGDAARAPYGPKPLGEVREYALDCLDHLVASGVKALVIACNSASAAVLRDARERYAVPVVEVVLPATRRAVAVTRNCRVGVICTRATQASMAYDDAFAAAPQVHLTTCACPLFVDFVERGITTGPDVEAAAREYLEPLRAAAVDTLILGCTHYPLLSDVVTSVVGRGVTLVSSAEESAADLQRVLAGHGLLRRDDAAPRHRFVTTGQPEEFLAGGRRFLGPEIDAVTQFAFVGDTRLPSGAMRPISA